MAPRNLRRPVAVTGSGSGGRVTSSGMEGAAGPAPSTPGGSGPGLRQRLAGKYDAAMQAARDSLQPGGTLDSARTAALAPAAYGLISAGGSVLGNVTDNEDEGAGRILAEAVGAGALGALIGGGIGRLGQENTALRRNINALGNEAAPYMSRGIKAAEAGAMDTARAANQKALPLVERMAAEEALLKANRAGQAIGLGAMPVAAGLGGLLGGGVSNLGNAMGIPGLQPQQQYVDPEQYGSSNTVGARAATTTMQYV